MVFHLSSLTSIRSRAESTVDGAFVEEVLEGKCSVLRIRTPMICVISLRDRTFLYGNPFAFGGIQVFSDMVRIETVVLISSDNLEQDVLPHSIGNRLAPDLCAEREFNYLLLSCTEETVAGSIAQHRT